MLKFKIQMIIKGGFKEKETIQTLPEKDLQGNRRTLSRPHSQHGARPKGDAQETPTLMAEMRKLRLREGKGTPLTWEEEG